VPSKFRVGALLTGPPDGTRGRAASPIPPDLDALCTSLGDQNNVYLNGPTIRPKQPHRSSLSRAIVQLARAIIGGDTAEKAGLMTPAEVSTA
jgi:hypothetical protein